MSLESAVPTPYARAPIPTTDWGKFQLFQIGLSADRGRGRAASTRVAEVSK